MNCTIHLCDDDSHKESKHCKQKLEKITNKRNKSA